MSLPQQPDDETRTPTVTVTRALEGLPITTSARLDDICLTAVVAATLRAALDMALAGGTPLRPLWITTDDAVMEIRLAIAQPDALALAGGLLEAIEGSLTRAPGERGDWILRVPLALARPTYLMLTQGTLGLAVPWHAVSRVRMLPSKMIERIARREGAHLLPPLAQAADIASERPAVLLGLGLKRAVLVADRLIWRLPAEPVTGGGLPDGRWLKRAVRTADGEVYWVLDLTEAMRNVRSSVPVPARPARPSSPPSPPDDRRRPEPATAPAERIDEPVELAPAVPESATPMEPLPTPLPLPASVAQEPNALEPEASRPAATPEPCPRTALLAEDSIIGRMFLARLLERRGYRVEIVTQAGQLDDALARGPWGLVLVDVELADSSNTDHLQRLVTAGVPRVAALVRDVDDAALAAANGILHHLRKPFEAEELDRLLPLLDPHWKET